MSPKRILGLAIAASALLPPTMSQLRASMIGRGWRGRDTWAHPHASEPLVGNWPVGRRK